MNKFYIYEIPGRKVGCTKSIESRKMLYKKFENSTPEIILLETLENVTEQEAGDREWEWADKLGYKRGTHYTKALEAMDKMRKLSHKSSNHPCNNKEHLKKLQKAAIESPNHPKFNPEKLNYTRSFSHKSPNHPCNNKEHLKKLQKASMDSPNHISKHPEKMAKIIKAAIESPNHPSKNPELVKRWMIAGQRGASKQVTCPHCNLTGRIGAMKRWHFENCRHKKEN